MSFKDAVTSLSKKNESIITKIKEATNTLAALTNAMAIKTICEAAAESANKALNNAMAAKKCRRVSQQGTRRRYGS